MMLGGEVDGDAKPEGGSSAADVMAQYGMPLRVYQGRGTLTAVPYRGLNSGGPEEFECSFVAAQLISGRILIACDMDPLPSGMAMRMDAQSLIGRTHDDRQLDAHGLTQTDSLDADAITGGVGLWLTFDANELVVRTGDTAHKRIAEWRYGLTNYLFDGAYVTLGDHRLENALRVQLPERAGEEARVLAILSRVPGYREIASRLRVLKNVAVTTEVLILAEHLTEHHAPDELVEVLAYVLSVGGGCRSQPVYREGYDESGRLASIRHQARIVRPFSSQELVPARAGHLATNQEYVELGVAAFLRWSALLPLKLVADAYLDAKAENDFLEARGAKLAVVLEALKHEFEPLLGERRPKPFLDKELFADLEGELLQCAHEWFKRRGLPQLLEDDMIAPDSFSDLNRAPFRQLVTALTEALDLLTTEEEIPALVASRNKLVHQGQFACVATAAQKGLPKPPSSEVIEEYLAVVHLLDRTVLRLLDYEGPYYRQRMGGKELFKLARKSESH